MGPTPAVAAVRLAVRQALADLAPDIGVLVACSGGADSLALAAATAFECVRAGRHHALATVDHDLQPGSAEQAARVAALGYELGFDPVHSIRVEVTAAGGPEAAARTARYAALEQVRAGAVVLLGHTADDQAETVLLGLGRGSGPRSIAAMRPVAGELRRPLLGLRRSVTEACCRDLGLDHWCDPHNDDPRYRRVRVRREVLPLLEEVLAGGVTEALARTADLLADDLDALDEIAGQVLRSAATEPAMAGCDLTVTVLTSQPSAVRRRVLRRWLTDAGVGGLGSVHLVGVERLVTDWHGQARIELPGNFFVLRASGRLVLQPGSDPAAATAQP